MANFVSLICDYTDASGNPIQQGKVVFTPNAQVLDTSTDHLILTQAPVVVDLSQSPAPTVRLIANDNSGMAPSGWSYLVSPQFPGAPPAQLFSLAYATGATQNLSDLLPVVSSPVVPTGGTYTGPLILDGSPPMQIPAGAASGKVLTSDASGNVSWVAEPGSTAVALTPTTVKTGAYTAAASDFVRCDTTTAWNSPSAGLSTITLPAAPANGTVIGIKLVASASPVNVVTIACGGSDVFNSAGGATTATLSMLRQGITVQYIATGAIWLVFTDDLPLSGLDTRYALLTGASMTGGLVTQMPNIVFDGDSLTIGTGALPFNNFPQSNDFPSQVAASLDHRGAYYNVAVAGEQVSAMITNAPTVVDAKLVAGANNVVCFHGGTNDLQSTDNATTTYNRIVTYCQARQAAGWKVVIGTLTPRSDAGTPGDFDTVRLSVNASIRANWATFANALADIGADAVMGQSGNQSNTQYYNGDLVHHNATGYRVVAGYFLAALSKLGITGHQHGDKQGIISDLWVPAGQFGLISGAPVLGPVNNTAAWLLHHGATDGIGAPVIIPPDWLSFSLNVWWACAASITGNAVLRGDLLPLSSGSTLTIGNLTGGQKTVAPSGFSAVNVTSLRGTDNVQNTDAPSRTVFDVHILRLGTSGSDTLTGDTVGVIGAYLFRVA